jgi:predicted CXXCH cytochrome family protein
VRAGAASFLLSLLFIAAFVPACSTDSRHKVKTFFFTGVPEPGKEQAEVTQTGIEAPLVKQNIQHKQNGVPASPFFLHGPFGAGQCQKCHAVTESKPFRNRLAKSGNGNITRTVNIGPRLAYPLEELCISCHSEKSQATARANGLWLHGPVAKGWCTQCHNPHKSQRQYMLQKTNIELCNQCHLTADLQVTLEHQQNPDTDCVSCHNPHMGKFATLLRTEYDEWQRFK